MGTGLQRTWAGGAGRAGVCAQGVAGGCVCRGGTAGLAVSASDGLPSLVLTSDITWLEKQVTSGGDVEDGVEPRCKAGKHLQSRDGEPGAMALTPSWENRLRAARTGGRSDSIVSGAEIQSIFSSS